MARSWQTAVQRHKDLTASKYPHLRQIDVSKSRRAPFRRVLTHKGISRFVVVPDPATEKTLGWERIRNFVYMAGPMTCLLLTDKSAVWFHVRHLPWKYEEMLGGRIPMTQHQRDQIRGVRDFKSTKRLVEQTQTLTSE